MVYISGLYVLSYQGIRSNNNHPPPPPLLRSTLSSAFLSTFTSPAASASSTRVLSQMQQMRSLKSGFSAIDSSTSFLVQNASHMPNNPSATVPFFPSGLSALAMIVHLCTHPKIKDWLQLLFLGIAATFARKASKEAKGWLQRVFCVTSVHLMNDESYDWLMGKCYSSDKTRGLIQASILSLKPTGCMIPNGRKGAGSCQYTTRDIWFLLMSCDFAATASNCEVSRISGNIHIRPWMRTSRRASLEDRHAEPEPRFIPMPG
jgi:hypothetical protein